MSERGPEARSPSARRWLLVAVMIPIAGLLVLIARAEWSVRTGSTWTIPIVGFDPRDMLHGRFLQYRYAFDWHGADECGSPSGPKRPGFGPEAAFERLRPGCCLCLKRTDPSGRNPAVRQVECQAARTDCEAYLRSDRVMPPQRFFIPEEHAEQLERSLSTRQASIELRASASGEPAVVELYLDGRPWGETLTR